MAHVTGSQSKLIVPLGTDVSFFIDRKPVPFMSPVSYSISEEPTILDDDLIRDFDFEHADKEFDELDEAEMTVTLEED